MVMNKMNCYLYDRKNNKIIDEKQFFTIFFKLLYTNDLLTAVYL